MMRSVFATLITSARRRSNIVPEDHVSKKDVVDEELTAAFATPNSSPNISHYDTAMSYSVCDARSSTSSVTNEAAVPGIVVLNEEGDADIGSVIATRKPHHANDERWAAVQAVQKSLEPHHFEFKKLLRSGEIGNVYLAELRGTESIFAVKVINKEALAKQKRPSWAKTEREILQDLDHPFLPTLYTHFDYHHYTCLVMDFCPGGDLDRLRQQRHGQCFSEREARFYVSEVLIALEYLHMEGIIYRDLKPENVLLREDGHIMLSDFDRCQVSPTLDKATNLDEEYCKKPEYQVQSFSTKPTCMPSCLLPLCFSSGLSKKHSRKQRRPLQAMPSSEFLAEPISVRSMSIVGSHEYLASEIVNGVGYGSAVDWWTLGIFLYELLYGKTPFKGANNNATLLNVVTNPLEFPESPAVSFAARDLIRGLLLGCMRGAKEIKQHPFFQGMNWALIRNTRPHWVPEPFEIYQSESRGDLFAGSGGDVFAVDMKASDTNSDMDIF